jgi:hypothetical protein
MFRFHNGLDFGGRYVSCRFLSRLGSKNFGTAVLGDSRRTERLVNAAADIAAHSALPFNQIFDWNDLRGFYRLCNQKAATVDAIQTPHRQQTLQEMAKHPLVLILHDTTEIDLTRHTALHDIGPIGDGRGRGFLQHNSLAVLPHPGRVLGLAYQQYYLRQEAPANESSKKRRQRERESLLWMRGIDGVGRPPQGCRWVDVGDRGADIYDAMVASLAQGHDFLYRVKENRLLSKTREGASKPCALKMMDYARSLTAKGCDTVDIPARGGRAERAAKVKLASAKVWIPAPQDMAKRASQPIVEAWVVRVWEPNPPPDVEALEWILITSVATDIFEEMRERRDWYACRWMVEVFHHIEKNGCGEEARRFETAARMVACLALLSVVAVRIFQMRTSLKTEPAAPAEQIATAAEIEVVGKFLGISKCAWTIADFVRGVARLGGFMGRKHDGDPGVLTLWRGYQRLQDLLLGYQLHRGRDEQDVGNR